MRGLIAPCTNHIAVLSKSECKVRVEFLTGFLMQRFFFFISAMQFDAFPPMSTSFHLLFSRKTTSLLPNRSHCSVSFMSSCKLLSAAFVDHLLVSIPSGGSHLYCLIYYITYIKTTLYHRYIRRSHAVRCAQDASAPSVFRFCENPQYYFEIKT